MVKAAIFSLGTNGLVGFSSDINLALAVGLLPSGIPYILTPFFMPLVNFVAFKNLGRNPSVVR